MRDKIRLFQQPILGSITALQVDEQGDMVTYSLLHQEVWSNVFDDYDWRDLPDNINALEFTASTDVSYMGAAPPKPYKTRRLRAK